MRKGKKPKVEEFTVEQEVIRTDVKGQSFDMLFRFTKGSDQVEFFMDELVKLILDGMLDRYGQIVVKVNWWAEGLQVIAPNGIPEQQPIDNALQGTSQASTATMDSNPSPNTTLEK
jgi:hypothetical protein